MIRYGREAGINRQRHPPPPPHRAATARAAALIRRDGRMRASRRLARRLHAIAAAAALALRICYDRERQRELQEEDTHMPRYIIELQRVHTVYERGHTARESTPKKIATVIQGGHGKAEESAVIEMKKAEKRRV